jgi:hypothetical protein
MTASNCLSRLAMSALLVAFLFSSRAYAQDLTPRAYWPAPNGTKIFVLGYSYQTGDIVTDPSLPLIGVDSKIDSLVVAYLQTISLFGRTSNFQIELPYVEGKTTGTYLNEPARSDVSGFGDLAATLSINLVGAATMNLEGFRELVQNPRPILGASLKVVAPTGEYDADKLINIGTNRWAIRAKLGYIHPLSQKWIMELTVGAWFFEDNDEFLGVTREQKPITALNVSFIRSFQPTFWVSLDLNYYLGGRTTIGGTKSANFQRNSRVGFTIVHSIKGRHAIKGSFSNGVITESGGDYQIISISYIYAID